MAETLKEGDRVVCTDGPQRDQRGEVCYQNRDGTICVDFDHAGRVLNVAPQHLQKVASPIKKKR